MAIKLKNTGSSDAMKRHYQRLIETGWGAYVSKETREIKGINPRWDTEEDFYTLDVDPDAAWAFLFDLSEDLGEELILYKEDGQPVIEIYDSWRE